MPRGRWARRRCYTHLDAALGARPDFPAIALSFEAYESWPLSDFWADFSERMAYQLSKALPGKNHPNREAIAALLAGQMAVDERSFQRFFRQLYQLAPTLKVVLIIDEFDATPQAVLSPLLQTWRTMYLDRQPPHSLHSVVLVGIQNIARLNFGRSSPFNIAYQHRLKDFSLDEVRDLLGQYTAETGQAFSPSVIEKLYEQTAGQPFLVNRTWRS